jgi:phage-related minor tail protein
MSREEPVTSTTDRLAALTQQIDALAHDADPIHRARQAKTLIVDAQRVLSDIHREAVYEATRSESWATVAEALGVSAAAINLAVSNHRKTLSAARTRGVDS